MFLNQLSHKNRSDQNTLYNVGNLQVRFTCALLTTRNAVPQKHSWLTHGPSLQIVLVNLSHRHESFVHLNNCEYSFCSSKLSVLAGSQTYTSRSSRSSSFNHKICQWHYSFRGYKGGKWKYYKNYRSHKGRAGLGCSFLLWVLPLDFLNALHNNFDYNFINEKCLYCVFNEYTAVTIGADPRGTCPPPNNLVGGTR